MSDNAMWFPPYAYVPGRHPHPTRHPAGHSYGRPAAPPTALDPDAWWTCAPYVEGLALFDRGYYWEAHEAWEAPWSAAARGSGVAELLGGLIALAAAGVKLRQNRGEAAARLAARAQARFDRARQACGTEQLAGLRFDALRRFAGHVVRTAPRSTAAADLAVEVVFPRPLSPSAPSPPA